MLNLKIKDANYNLNFLRSKSKYIKNRLFACIPDELVIDFFECSSEKFRKYNHKLKNNLTKKFDNLLREQNE